MTSETAQELKNILAQYNLGELVDLEKNERGFVNTAFAIDTVQNGERRRFFLRKYKRGIKEEELQFEHSLIDHLVETGACPAARIYRTRSGVSYLHHFEGPEDTAGSFLHHLRLPARRRPLHLGRPGPDGARANRVRRRFGQVPQRRQRPGAALAGEPSRRSSSCCQ